MVRLGVDICGLSIGVGCGRPGGKCSPKKFYENTKKMEIA